jgi:hypothetical protein
MAEYGLSDNHLLQMPLRRFWLLDKNITRLQAERELRQLPVMAATNGGDLVKVLADRLSQELGTVVTVNVMTRDPDATSKLKRLSAGRG